MTNRNFGCSLVLFLVLIFILVLVLPLAVVALILVFIRTVAIVGLVFVINLVGYDAAQVVLIFLVQQRFFELSPVLWDGTVFKDEIAVITGFLG